MSPWPAGMMRWFGRLQQTGILHHFFGIGGQVAAAAPTLVIAVMLSHIVGLVPAGQFVIAAAAAALIFTTTFLGLVYYVSVDRLRDFDARDFVFTRLITMVIALVVLFAVSGQLGVPLQLVLLVALLRVADAAVDMAWGFDLLQQSTTIAMRRYTFLNVAKLAIVVVPGLLVFVTDAVEPVPMLILGSVVAALVCWIWLMRLSRGERVTGRGNQLVRSARLARRAVWFTLNASSSAAIVSSPRLLLDRFYVGDPLGVVGVSLAFSQIFAMAFMSSWLRWFPRLSQAPENERRFSGLALESLAMGLVFLLLNMTVMPWVVSLMFGFKLPGQSELSREVLLASTLFGYAMNMANLFKVTRAVYLESVTYIVGITAGLLYVTMVPSSAVPGFLVAASVGMLAMVGAGTRWIRRRGAVVPVAGRNRALFLRLAGRPVPRVTRMMTVARDAGFDPLFVGAFRDKGLPAEDSWEGFPVRRVGQPFPLLNGKRPLLYVSAVLSCNLGFLSLLWRERPAVVHASDVEAMPAAILYRLTHATRLVFNIHDNLAQRYALPGWITACLNMVEGIFVLLSDQALVPETFRRNALPVWCRHKVRVIRNLPPDNGASPPPPFENGKIRIFYGGWLDWQRGLEALLALARQADIEVRIAGEGAPEIVNELKQHPAVTYLGFLDSKAVLAETVSCHFVPVLYDPSRVINRFAASNKLAESLSIGRPMILNEELEIAKELSDARCVLKTPYAEAASIVARLRALAADPAAYMLACDSARELYNLHYDWIKVRSDSLIALTGQ
jgi:glycosyltransferase involved in cell wall biosynthesis